MIRLVPLTRRAANEWIRLHHSHHGTVRSDYCRVGAERDGVLIGCVVAGLPTGPFSTAHVVEVTRLCTDHEPDAGSRLLGAIRIACLALGYRRLVSYTRVDEAGTVYRAAGWWPTAEVAGREHNTGNRGLRWLPGIYEPATETRAPTPPR